MFIAILSSDLALTVAGIGAMWFAMHYAVEGHEDDFGFHQLAPDRGF